MAGSKKLKRIYLVAGEDSGDLHAGNLLKELRATEPELEARGMGGDVMAEAGCQLVAHVREGNFMGFAEVVRNLGTIRELFRRLKADVRAWQPDAVVLVDYPGFNLRLAPFFKSLGIPVYYYISPQLWAWKKGRVKTVKAFVDRMFVILPFEEDFYRQEGVEVEFVGHPLLDALPETTAASESGQPVIALLPGSRRQEIKKMLPVMLSLLPHFPNHRFIIAGARSQPMELYQELVGESAVEIWQNRTYELLGLARAAAVTSGTATLETALLGVPEVVCYKGSALSYAIGKRLVKVPFISLVNLILGRRAVTELIQHEMNSGRLLEEMKALLSVGLREQLTADYAELRTRLGDRGASRRTAEGLLRHFSTLPTHSA